MDVYPPRPAPIDGDELMKAFYNTPKHRQTWHHAWWLINHAKLVEPKTGRWIHERLASTNGGTYAVVRCSVCKSQFPMWETNYCPNCGARMEVEHEREKI